MRFARIARSGHSAPAVRAGPRARTVARQTVPAALQRQPPTVADVDSPLEREADKIADWIMALPPRAGLPRVQRMCGECADELRRQPMEEDEEKEELQLEPATCGPRAAGAEAAAAAVAQGGHPLSAAERAYFEPRFGRDFSGVRIHDDPRAHSAADAINARAFTFGQHVAFNKGAYRPVTASGLRLLAHELAHTVQQDADRRISRACAQSLRSLLTPPGDSVLTASATVDLESVEVAPGITAAPLIGRFHVKFHLPRALQRAISPELLGNLTVTADISAQIASPNVSVGSRIAPGEELCVFVTFHPEAPAGQVADNWFADVRLLAGSELSTSLQFGGARGIVPAQLPIGIGSARLSLRLSEDMTASVGPVQITSINDVRAVWQQIREQLKDLLALRLRNLALPLDLRARAAATIPVPLGTSAEESGPIIPVDVFGDIRLRTEVSSSRERFRIRLSGATGGRTAAGLISLELFGSGSLRGPLPSTIRLGDLSDDFLANLLRASEGSGEIGGRLTAFGIPGRIDAGFRLEAGRVVGSGRFLSPVGIGAGTFAYGFDEGLSAQLGLFGLTQLVLSPAEQRPVPRRGDLAAEARAVASETAQGIGPQPFDLGSTVTGIGVTGASISPTSTSVLSLGVGPQFITTPTGRTEVGTFGGITYTLTF